MSSLSFEVASNFFDADLADGAFVGILALGDDDLAVGESFAAFAFGLAFSVDADADALAFAEGVTRPPRGLFPLGGGFGIDEG